MKRLIRNILNEMDDTHGRSAWASVVRRYAVDILSRYIDCRGLNIWDEAERIGKGTDRDKNCKWPQKRRKYE